MNAYDGYSTRQRNRLGVYLKTKLARKLVANVKKNSQRPRARVLEIGPGDGTIGLVCRQRNHRYRAVEANPQIAAHLASLGLEVENVTVPPLPRSGDSCDTCFLLHVIEHMRNLEECRVLLRDIFSVMDPEGNLVVLTPDFSAWGPHFYHCDATHQTPFTRERLHRILRENGFEIACHKVFYGQYSGKWLVRPIASMNRILNRLAVAFPRSSRRNLWSRGLWTFLPCLFVVARKKVQALSSRETT